MLAMSPKKSHLVLLLATTTLAANITTSFTLPNPNLLPTRIRFLASVISADASNNRLTLAATYDNDPDYSALDLALDVTLTMTLAPTLYAQSTTYNPGSDNEYRIKRRCDFATGTGSGSSSAACTAEYNSALALRECLRSPASSTSSSDTPDTITQTSQPLETLRWTFSDTDTRGVQTIVRPAGEDYYPSQRPAWCSNYYTWGESAVSVPDSALTSSYTLSGSQVGVFGFTITAGGEKIPAAMTGASATVKGTTPIETKGGATTATSGSVGAAPARTVAPALAGLGAAVAVFL